jgi:hypothetical protein
MTQCASRLDRKELMLFCTAHITEEGRVTNDGHTIAQVIELRHESDKLAANIFKDTAKRTNEEAGDGYPHTGCGIFAQNEKQEEDRAITATLRRHTILRLISNVLTAGTRMFAYPQRSRAYWNNFDSMDQNEQDTGGRCQCPDCRDEYCEKSIRPKHEPRIMSKYMICECCKTDWPVEK